MPNPVRRCSRLGRAPGQASRELPADPRRTVQQTVCLGSRKRDGRWANSAQTCRLARGFSCGDPPKTSLRCWLASNAAVVGLAVNNTALPPGRICGQRWVTSPFCKSVTGVGGPPAEGIRDKPPVVLSAAMMLPSSPQLPPATIGCVAQGDCRAALHRNLLQLSWSEESDPLPVRGEERRICPLRSCKLSGVGLIEPPGKEPPLRHIHEPRAIGRNDFVGPG